MSSSNGAAKMTRDELRTKLLGTRVAPERKQLTLFGQDVELRQPSMRAIMEARAMENNVHRAAYMVIRFCVVPGTDEPLFEEGDIESILDWPFGKDLVAINKAIAELTGIDIEDDESGIDVTKALKEVESNPLADSSSSSPAS